MSQNAKQTVAYLEDALSYDRWLNRPHCINHSRQQLKGDTGQESPSAKV